MVARVLRADDVANAAGELLEADVTRYIGIDGEWREIDLTDANDEGMRDTLKRYWDAGRTVSPDVVTGATMTDLSSMRHFWDGYRAWCDERGINYTTKVAKKFYPSPPKVREYLKWLLDKGQVVPPKVAEKYGVAA